MICIKHNFGMKKGRSIQKTDRIRPGKAPGRPAYTSWAGRPRPLWSGLGLQKFRETLWIFAYLCFIESVLWKGSEQREKIWERKKREEEREKKKCMRREEKKNKWRDSMVREVQRDITLLFENNILNSNHVQSDNEDDACAFAHVHHSKSSYPWTLYIMEKLSWSLAPKVSNH